MIELDAPESAAGWSELVILAVVQGVAEFLPISSSGHLVLAQELLGVHEASIALEVALHVGTLLAVVAVYWKDLVAIAVDVAHGRVAEVGLLVLGSIPAGLVGVFGAEFIEKVFDDVRWVAAGLFVTAALLAAGEWLRRRRGRFEGPMTILGVLFVGAFQALAIWPGISRSGSTIAAGLALGWGAKRAARFSFLLSIIAIGGAALLRLPDVLQEPGQAARLGFGVGVAAVVGVLALRWLLARLERGAFVNFAVYCAFAGVVVAGLTW
ncbi:MAG: undecaprenyl-diphosphate phosphatase [Planctomycetota bacterium]